MNNISIIYSDGNGYKPVHVRLRLPDYAPDYISMIRKYFINQELAQQWWPLNTVYNGN